MARREVTGKKLGVTASPVGQDVDAAEDEGAEDAEDHRCHKALGEVDREKMSAKRKAKPGKFERLHELLGAFGNPSIWNSVSRRQGCRNATQVP